MSGGRLAWGVIWRLLIAGIVFSVLAILPSIFIPEDGGPQKAFEITDAKTRVELQDDASLHVSEQLHFEYQGGSFSGAYRDIPVREGAQITHITVAEGGRAYRPGGNTELGSTDRPGSFGVTETPDYLSLIHI